MATPTIEATAEPIKLGLWAKFKMKAKAAWGWCVKAAKQAWETIREYWWVGALALFGVGLTVLGYVLMGETWANALALTLMMIGQALMYVAIFGIVYILLQAILFAAVRSRRA